MSRFWWWTSAATVGSLKRGMVPDQIDKLPKTLSCNTKMELELPFIERVFVAGIEKDVEPMLSLPIGSSLFQVPTLLDTT